MRILSVIAVTFVLAGCETNHVTGLLHEGTVDRSDRTITVPAGSFLLFGAVKEALSQTGWKMVVDRGPDVTRGTLGESTNLASSKTFLTRYRFSGKARQYDLCEPDNPAVVYDLSVIDNKTGQEVLTQSGRGCVNETAKDFVDRLNSK